MMELILLRHAESVSRLDSTVKRLLLMLALAVWKRPGLLKQLLNDTTLTADSFGVFNLADCDWTNTTFGTAELYNSIRQLNDLNLIPIATTVSDLATLFRRLLFYDTLSFGPSTKELVDLFHRSGQFFSVEDLKPMV